MERTIGTGAVTGSPKPPKVAVLVAQQMVDEIVRNGLEPGEMLPRERDMIGQYTSLMRVCERVIAKAEGK